MALFLKSLAINKSRTMGAYDLKVWALFGVAFVSACGDALWVAGDIGGTLFRIEGRLTNTDNVATNDHLKVALVWGPTGSGAGWTAQAVDVAAFSFPATFELEVTELPPPEAMKAWRDELANPTETPDPDITGRFAAGFLVAFEDRDGDGTLGIPSTATVELPDRILGITDPWVTGQLEPNILLFYNEGETPEEVGIPSIQRGFNIMQLNREYVADNERLAEERRQCIRTHSAEQVRTQCDRVSSEVPLLLPHPDEVVVIRLTDSPALVERFCPTVERRTFEVNDTCELAVKAENLVCSADGLFAEWTEQYPDTDPAACVTTGGLVQCSDYVFGVVPLWWPCPL